jgi:hypothetical protein
MKLVLQRSRESTKCIIGDLFVDSQWECCTLEPARVNPVIAGHPAIPVGEYKIALTPSPKLGYITPEVLDVPNRTAIRIHVGNFPNNTEGCTLVGEEKGANQLFRSQASFDRLMTLLRTAIDEVTIEYKEIE